MKNEIQRTLQQISDVLLINGGFLDNPGLFSGEMGLVLFFTRYARYTRNDLYMDYSYNLIEKIQKKVYQHTTINYKHGLTGIGSAIEYLVQKGYFEADTDEILEELDKRIFFTYNIQYLSINEIIGIGHYVGWRISGKSIQKDLIRQTILPQIEKVMHEHSVFPDWHFLHQKKIPDSFGEKTYNRCLELITENNFWGKEIGIQDGLAGWGMFLLTELDDDDSWLLLFPEDSINIKY